MPTSIVKDGKKFNSVEIEINIVLPECHGPEEGGTKTEDSKIITTLISTDYKFL